MRLFWKIPLISRAIFALWLADARRKYRWVSDWIDPKDKLLEIGSGPGSVIRAFRDAGMQVTGLDIHDSSFDDTLIPVVYDGAVMPFEDKQFDTALLLTTLHHTPDPDVILQEASRVARRVIIIEDIYDTPFQRAYTMLTDKITNMEFIGHPHSNRPHDGWLKTFEGMGLRLRHQQRYRLAGIYQQAVYILDAV